MGLEIKYTTTSLPAEYFLDSDPTLFAWGGTNAEIGSLLIRTDNNSIWRKSGPLPTNWTFIGIGPPGPIGPIGPIGPVGSSGTIIFGNDNIGASTTLRFLDPGYGPTAVSSTDLIEMVCARDGVLRSMFARHNSASGNGVVVTYTVAVNNVATLLLVALASGAIGQASNLVNTVNVLRGDRVSVRVTKPASITVGTTRSVISMEFA